MLAIAVPIAIAASDTTNYTGYASRAPNLKPVASRPVTTTTRPTTSQVPVVVGGEVAVSSSIDATGKTDVTGALNSFFALVPDGTQIDFPLSGRFRIEGTLVLKNRKNLIVKGQGATFFATSNGLTKSAAGCSRDSSVCRYPNRTRSQWLLDRDTNLLMRDVNVIGSSPGAGPNGAYKGNLEAQHAFQITGGRDITLDHVTGKDVWGDLVNIGRAQSGSLKSPTNVIVENSTFSGAARQGWSITNGQHVTFQNNSLFSVRRSLVDIEANVSSDQIAYITIRNNRLGAYRFCTFTNYGAPAVEHDFVFSGNQSLGSPIKICGLARESARRKNFDIVDNIGSTGGYMPNEPMVSLAYFDNVVVEGNVQKFNASGWPKRGGVNGSPQAPVTWTCTTGVVTGNTFTPRPSAMSESSAKSC